MASGMDQNRVNDFLNVAIGEASTGTTALTNGFHGGGSNLGHIRLITPTVTWNSANNGTELSGGSYVQGTGITYATGPSGAFSASSYSSGAGSTSNNTTLSQTGMPAATIIGIEIWDSAGTPLRWWWGALQSQITTNNGDTLSFTSGAIVATLTA